MIKIAHEAPLSIFDKVQQITDYDYFLVHLFEENEEYLKKAQECVANGRETILDNSIFELGTAWDAGSFAYWVKAMKPTWYIVPDVLDQALPTIDLFNSFMDFYPDLPGKAIGVAQGSSYDELVSCYEYMKNDDRVDKIALSFDSPFFQEYEGDNKYIKMMNARQDTLAKMLAEGVIDTSKQHHLLGCGLPQEFKAYVKYDWIDSLDTSNPVVHGIKDIFYDSNGLMNKASVKLYTMIDEDVNDAWGTIEYNIKSFKSMCR